MNGVKGEGPDRSWNTDFREITGRVDLSYDCLHSISPNQWASTCRWENSKRNAFFLLMPSSAISFGACARKGD